MKNDIKQTAYKPAYDAINILACIAVIILHVNGAVWDFQYSLNWITCVAAECIFFWAVPVFFMLTGATLIDYRSRYSTKEFFSKRITKTLIPFLFWSCVSIFWGVYVSHSLEPEYLSGLRSFIDALINVRAMSIYWFFPVLFSLYLIIPFLSDIPDEKKYRMFKYFIVCAFTVVAVLPVVFYLLQIQFNGAFSFPLNGGDM